MLNAQKLHCLNNEPFSGWMNKFFYRSFSESGMVLWLAELISEFLSLDKLSVGPRSNYAVKSK